MSKPFYCTAMKSFYVKEEYSFEDIKLLIDNEVEESIYLEFKDARSIDKNESKKRELAKDVSAFANSDGGIIIYGIREEEHKASKITYINGEIFTKEWLEQVISSSIQRRIENLKIIPIRYNNDLNKTIYLVKIPASDDSPHLSKDKRYYKRFNFQSVSMEEYEIRQSYKKKALSKLYIGKWKILEKETIPDPSEEIMRRVVCEVSVFNAGSSSEDQYKVNIIFKDFNNLLKVSWDKTLQKCDYIDIGDGRVKLSFFGKMPIFPNEVINAARFNIKIPEEKIKEALEKVKIEIRLLYSNGEDLLETNLLSILED